MQYIEGLLTLASSLFYWLMVHFSVLVRPKWHTDVRVVMYDMFMILYYTAFSRQR